MPTTPATDPFSLNHLYWKRRIQQCKAEFKHHSERPIAQPTQTTAAEQAQPSDTPSPQPRSSSRPTPKRQPLHYDVK